MKINEILTEETDEVKDMLLKLRKDSTGFLNPAKLVKIIATLKGWSIEKQTFVSDTNKIDIDAQKELGGYPNLNFRDGLTVDGKIDCSFTLFDSNKSGKNYSDLVDKVYTEMSSLAKHPIPAKPKSGTFYFSDVTEPKIEKGHSWETYGFNFKAKYASSGFLVTAPNGKTFELKKEPGYNGIEMGGFIRWYKTETSFTQDVLDALGMESHETSKQVARTRENTGTCPCCFKEYKLISNKMVHHGYQRPGHGYIVGDCFGVGYKPFEKSPDGTKDYKKELEKLLTKEETHLKALKSGKIVQLHHSTNFRGIRKVEMITQTHEEWDKTLKIAITNSETQVKYIKQDIGTLDKKLDGWKEENLPWERINKSK